MTVEPPPLPPAERATQYRVSLMDKDNRSALPGRSFMLILDLTPGVQLDASRRRLDATLRRLLAQARPRVTPDRQGEYYLRVEPWAGGPVEFEWPVTWADEAA